MKKTKRTIITIDFYPDSPFFIFIDFREPGVQEVDLHLICHNVPILLPKKRKEAQLFCLLVFDSSTQAENPIL